MNICVVLPAEYFGEREDAAAVVVVLRPAFYERFEERKDGGTSRRGR